MKDITNQVFGKLTALEIDKELTKEKKRTYWKCHCECGREKSIRLDNLTSGRSTSCGSCKNDLTGQKFGLLTAIKKGTVDKNGHQKWFFQCDCGNIKEIAATNVIQGYTTSCGCVHSKVCSEKGKDLIGNKYGFLTVIKLAEISPRKYLCKCECGGEVIVNSKNLISGHTKSCGCLVSYGESQINNWLIKNNVPFKKEYTISEMKGFIGRPRFDFAIFGENGIKLLIKFHGKQHYEDTLYGKAEDRQNKDEIKRNWAKENNIPLYEIPYWELDNIENILEELVKVNADAPDMEEAQEIVDQG